MLRDDAAGICDSEPQSDNGKPYAMSERQSLLQSGAKKADDADTLTGNNVLGRLLMELREKLRTAPNTLAVVEPVPVSNFLLLDHLIPTVVADACGHARHEPSLQEVTL